MPLTNPRFAGDPVLEACAAGQHRMMAPESGPAVQKVQQALIDLGFALPVHGADGVFSDETGEAVVAYKTDRQIFPNDPVVGPKTMTSLDGEPALQAQPPTPPDDPIRQAEALVNEISRLLADLSGILAGLRSNR